jgi:hypothetical protein
MSNHSMKRYLAVAVAALALGACSEADKEVMWEPGYASVCFEADSLADTLVSCKDSVISFSFSLQSSDMTEYTVQVPVLVIGMPVSHDRTFMLAVDASKSTAVEGTNYKAFGTSFTMPAGKVLTTVPITLLRSEDEQQGYKELRLVVQNSADFPDPFVEEKSFICLRVSDQLMKPEWWDAWQEAGWFGKYSRVKYQKWIELYGAGDLGAAPGTGNYAMGSPQVAYYHNLLRQYFIDNPTTDEDGETVEVPKLK